MVAAEQVWEPGLEDEPAPGETEAHELEFESLGLSVKQVRELLSSLPRPEPGLLIKLTRDPRATVRKMAYGALSRGRSLARNEDMFRFGGIEYVAGVDEAGRGALAGPLVAAAVMFEPGVVIRGVNDSKLVPPEKREELYVEIFAKAVSVSVSFVDPALIDRWGLQMVNLKALGDAVRDIDPRCQCVICDHFSLKGLRVPAYGVPKADATFQSVAAASIVAKVERDRVMRSLHNRLPRYNFENNKGYATPEHLQALEVYGPSEFHRLSFSGVVAERGDEALWEE